MSYMQICKIPKPNDYDILVDFVHIPEGSKMQISSKLKRLRANHDQIRNQQP